MNRGTGFLRRRPVLGTELLLMLASLAFAAFYNGSLWTLLSGGLDPAAPRTLLLLGSLFLAVVCLQFAGLALLLPRPALKPVLVILFFCTAFASLYMDRYAIFLNQDMIRNVLKTDVAEASELVGLGILPHVLLYAVLPAALVLWVRLRPRPLGRAVLVRGGAVLAALAVAVGVLGIQYRDVASLVRSHRDARHLVTPTNYLTALFKVARADLADPPGPRRPIGLDAHRVLPAATGRQPTVLVLVIGETARSANFGLSGYARDTTPELRALNPIVYPRVEACGTSTEVSVPCMFAPVGRRQYDEERIHGEESLLHVLRRAGLEVRWIDNQSGCKGVCEGLPEERLGGDADPAWCNGTRCLDGILVPRTAAAVESATGDLVLVLHMLGNHGPAYSQRYPAEFERYRPACTSSELTDCPVEAIVNAYDNAILYTDHVLAGIINYLASRTDRDSALLYVSDHGESLGENGMYLHGLPWRLAPATQREVPMVAWLSPGMQASARIDEACLRRNTVGPVSHDNLFHSVLGLLDVRTQLHEPGLDLFAACRGGSNGQLLAQEPRTAVGP